MKFRTWTNDTAETDRDHVHPFTRYLRYHRIKAWYYARYHCIVYCDNIKPGTCITLFKHM